MRTLAAVLALLLAGPNLAFAQLRGVKADLAPIAESDVVRGSRARIALQVTVPERFHLQSDQPRDPLLIPTVLTIDPPAGVRVTEIVYPKATDFTLAGQAEPLAVFEHAFAIGVVLE